MPVTKSFSLHSAAGCLCVWVSLTACAPWKSNGLDLATNKRLSREIVAKKIADQLKYEPVFFIDSLLRERSTIFNRGEFLTSAKTFPDVFYSDWQMPVFPLALPDSLAQQVRYINGQSDLENGPETFLLFSPLLPTKRKGVFAMQVYYFQTGIDTFHKGESIALRLASRNYELYAVKGGQVKYRETLLSPDDFFSLPFLEFDRTAFILRKQRGTGMYSLFRIDDLPR